MSDIFIKVKSEDLIDKAGIVKTKVDTMQKAVNDAEQLLNNTASYWLGDAGDKRRKEFRDKKKEADEVINRLREYPDDLLQMAGLYTKSETDNVNESKGLPVDVIL